MVQQIVEGAAKFHMLRLGNPELLPSREIDIPVPGALHEADTGVAESPGAFCTKAAVLNQALICSCLLRSSDRCQSPTTSAVSPPIPVSELSRPARTVSGAPLTALAMPLNCQPPDVSLPFRSAGAAHGHIPQCGHDEVVRSVQAERSIIGLIVVMGCAAHCFLRPWLR